MSDPDSRQQVWSVFAEALEIFDKKNQDYGDAWRRNGWRGNVPRIFEKADRVKELLWRANPRTPAVGDEAAVDTLLDMLNSLAFAIINLREGVEFGHETPLSERVAAWIPASELAQQAPHVGIDYGFPAHAFYRGEDPESSGEIVVVDPVVLSETTEVRGRPTPDTPQA